MKPRRVIVTIELTTPASVKELKYSYSFPEMFDELIHQVQVNVVKEPKKVKK